MKWIRNQDRTWRRLTGILRPVLKNWLGADLEPIAAPRPAIILCNHVTDLDPIFVGAAYPGETLIFVASEHIARNSPRLRALMDQVFSPIYRRKATSAVDTCRKIMRALRSGKSVCIFGEGETTWNGRTNPIRPGTATLVKACGAPLITYRLHGGYFTAARWGRGIRRGQVTGRITGVMPAEEVKEKTAEEIEAFIQQGIQDDACAAQHRERVPYRGRHRADQIEALLFLCPKCGQIGTLRGKGNRIACSCGLRVTLDKCLLPEQPAPFPDIAAWDDGQLDAFREMLEKEPGLVLTEGDTELTLMKIGEDGISRLQAQGRLSMNDRELAVGDVRFPLSDISELALMQSRKMAISAKDQYYELEAPRPLCLRKYYLRWQWKKTHAE